ncbi:MAG: SpoIIE family protein phosphatase [Treponema sp.]|nr:SpoIIE family protein phosphatase [Treponema sp.]
MEGEENITEEVIDLSEFSDGASEDVDQSLFTGEEKKEQTQNEEFSSMLHEGFSPKQIGSIALYTEPVSVTVPLETVMQMFKEDEGLKAIPVEESDRVVGFIDRKKVDSVSSSMWKRFTSSSIADYIQRVDVILYAREYIENNLKKVSDTNRKYGISYFPVFNGKSFFGLVSLDDFLDRTAEIREQDLAKASVIQQSFFPHGDVCGSLPYRFQYWNQMANALGGDMISVYRLSDSRSLVGCFDVSGKNVAASLLTITVGAFFHSLLATHNKEQNPVRIIAMLDAYLARVVPPGNFITAAFCYADCESKKFCVFNCGHTTTYLIRKQGDKVYDVSIDPKLPPMGMGAVHDQLLSSLKEGNTKYPYSAYSMSQGLHLSLYSDGFTDMKDEQGVRYDDEKAKEFFLHLYDVADEEVKDEIGKAVKDWVGTAILPDDVTVIDIRF